MPFVYNVNVTIPKQKKEKQLEKEFKVFREWSFTVSYSTKLDYDNLKLSGPF